MTNHPSRPKKSKVEKSTTESAPSETVLSYKGFSRDFMCRGFQFEVGKTYQHDGPVEICASGFHACEHPLDVFGYYSPAESRFAEVEQSGDLGRHSQDTKVVSASITIKAEINLSQVIERAVKWVTSRAKPEGDGGRATGHSGAASATGHRGAASATGDSGAASATGRFGRVQGTEGCALFLVSRDENWKIKHVWAGIVGQNGVKPMTWYSLNESGEPIEVQ